MKLKKALDIRDGEVISLVGGGGKTTLMFALAGELVSSGKTVVATTTTKIFEPLSSETPLLLLEADEDKLMSLVFQNLDEYMHITIAREKLSSTKLKGVSAGLVDKLAELNRISCIIVEADGAAGKSLKAPGPHEPVIPHHSTLVMPVVGIDADGCRLTEEHVFRPEIVSKLLGLPLGQVISAEAIAFLITDSWGIIKGSPAQARIIPFINKVDTDKGLARGRDLASKILAVEHPQVERVILGQALFPEPAVEVILRGSGSVSDSL